MENIVTLCHGDGGKYTNLLINEIFYKNFDNDLLLNSLDASVFEVAQGKLAFTTDSYVVKPLFFSGGDIGKLAVCGTINDLATVGAKPLYLSCGIIIEEGFDMGLLEKIAQSMGDICIKSGVKIITGDTKVVEKGFVDGLFINTSGIGVVQGGYSSKQIQEGDQIIITGGIAEHGTTIAIERYHIEVVGNIKSDCMSLNSIVERLKHYMGNIKLMKDPTRGGLATALNEIVEVSGRGVCLLEEAIPITREVKTINELLGLDPLYIASEGRMIIIVENEKSQEVLEEIKRCQGCEDAAIIGKFTSNEVRPNVLLETCMGGKRMLQPLEGVMLPRIC